MKEAIRRKRVQDSGESMTALKMPAAGSDGQVRYGEQLRATLTSMHLWFRFIEFDEPVKTVAQAAGKVQTEKIAKSIVMIDSNGEPLLAIVPALSIVSHKKLNWTLECQRCAAGECARSASAFRLSRGRYPAVQ